VAGQVVGNHDVPRAQRWAQELVKVSHKQRTIHRAVDHHGRGDLALPQASDEGAALVVPVRSAADTACATRRPAPKPCHGGGHRGFIQEHQLACLPGALIGQPLAARLLDVRSLLFAGVQRFF